MTYVQRQVQAQDIRSGEQLVKADILGTTGSLLRKLVAVVVHSLHAEDFHLDLEVAANATHTQDTEGLALRVVSECWGRATFPLTLAKCNHRGVEVAESTQDQEHSRVRGAVVCNTGDVRDKKRGISGRTSMGINLVVSSA